MGDSYTDFIETVSTSPTDINACQNAFNNLVTTWLNSTGVLNNLTDENANVTAAMLKNMGVANADEIVTNKLATAKEYAAIESENLSGSIEEEIIRLVNEDGQLTDSELALMQYTIAKETANGTVLNVDGDLTNLQALVEGLGGATEALSRFAEFKKLITKYDSGDDEFIQKEFEKRKQEALSEVKAALSKTTNTNAKVNYTGGTKSNKESTKSTKDAWKEAFEEEKKLLDHNLAMEYITQREYYDSLEKLNNKYFKDRKKYLDEYRQYEEEVFQGMAKVRQDEFNESSSVLEYSVKVVARDEDTEDLQLQLYKSLQKLTQDEIDWYLAQGLSGTDDIIRELNEKLWSYQDSEMNIYKSILDDRIDAYENYVDKCNDYAQWGSDTEIDAWKRCLSEIKKMYSEGKLSAKDYADYSAKLMEKIVDATKSGFEKYRDKVVQEIDNKIDALENKKDNRLDKYDEQIDALKEEKDLLSEEADEADRLLAIEKARMDLDKAKNQKKKIYREGLGYVYEADQSAVDEAQNTLDDLISEYEKYQKEKEIDNQIEELEKLKDSYEDTINAEIDKLEDLKDQWKDSLNQDENIDNFISKFQELEELEGLSIDKRISKLNEFKKAYLSAMGIETDTSEESGNKIASVSWKGEVDGKQVGGNAATMEEAQQMAASKGATNVEFKTIYEESTGAVEKNTSTISDNISIMTDNVIAVGENTTSIDSNSTNVGENTTSINNLNNNVEDNIDELHDNTSSISDLIQAIYNLRSAINSLNSTMASSSSDSEDSSSYNISKYHTGGIIGHKTKLMFDLANEKVKPDEELAIIQKGEALLNQPQISNLYDYISMLETSNVSPNISIGKTAYSSLPNSNEKPTEIINNYAVEANFPGVSAENEIRKVFENLPALAEQRKRRI